MNIENGEYRVEINGVPHWIKVEGLENNTMNSKMIVFNHSAHFPYLEEQNNFIDKVKSFLLNQ